MSKPITALRVSIARSESGAHPSIVSVHLSNGRTLEHAVSFNASQEEVLKATINAVVDVNMPARPERLSRGLVETLIAIRRAVGEKNENSVHLERETSLKLAQVTNAQKLRYHALITKDLGAGAGYWLITRRGAKFLAGEIDVPQSVTVKGDTVIDHSDVHVDIVDVMNSSAPRFDDKYAFRPHPSELPMTQGVLL